LEVLIPKDFKRVAPVDTMLCQAVGMFREIWLKTWVVVANALLFLYSIATTVRDAFSTETQQKYQLNILLHHWSPKTWVMIFVIANLAVVLQGARSAIRNRDNTIADLNTQLREMKGVAPHVTVDFTYSRGDDDTRPFTLRNHGPGVALKVSINPIELGDTLVGFLPINYISQDEIRFMVPEVIFDSVAKKVISSIAGKFIEALRHTRPEALPNYPIVEKIGTLNFCNSHDVLFEHDFKIIWNVSLDSVRTEMAGTLRRAPSE
jgi:hypothetical protein